MRTIFQKKLFSRWKTTLAKFFSYYWILQISGNNFLGATKLYGAPWASNKITSVIPKRLLKTKFFEKKTVFQARVLFEPILSRKIGYENLIEHFIRVQRVLWQTLSKLKDLFLRPYDVDENNFSKNVYFRDEKQFWPIFSRITEYGKPQVTIS